MLLIVGALGAALRWGAMALDPPVALLPALQLLHAASFGATHLGMLGFVAAKAPPGQGATAQAHLAVALGTTMAAATAMSGVLYGRFGSLAYAAMASAAVAGGVAAYIANRASRRRACERACTRGVAEQLRTIPLRSWPSRKIIRRDRPPCRLIQCRTDAG